MMWYRECKNKSFKDKLKGGLADSKTPKDFDSDSLIEGINIELEHTEDKDLALEIAMDHLTEDKDYYKKLKMVEASDDSFLSGKDWKTYKKFAPILVIDYNEEDDKLIDNLKSFSVIQEKNGKFIVDTLEGEQDIKKGDVICKGVEGEYWVQPKKRLLKKYNLNKDYNSRGRLPWKEYLPKGEEVEAIQIKDKDTFKVKTMNGKKNDWVLRDKDNHDDKWIVDNNLFKKTYKKV